MDSTRTAAQCGNRFEQEDTPREKQAYRLTAEGPRRLAGEVERMRALSRTRPPG